VTDIGYRAFFGCSSLREVTFPAGVASIGTDAFAACPLLTSATFKGLSDPMFGTNVFTKYAEGGITIYYSAGGTGYDSVGYPAQSPSGIDVPVSGNLKITFKGAMTLLVKTGTIGGSHGKLNPAGTISRAEMAQVLFNLLRKQCNEAFPQGKERELEIE